MKYLNQLLIIFAFTMIGELLSWGLSPLINLPASILGMICFFICLHWKLISIEQVKTLGDYLTANMAILFVPGGVGLMTQFHLIEGQWLQWLLTIFITTSSVLILVAFLMQKFLGNSALDMKGDQND